MPQESFESYVTKILAKYQYPDRAKGDVCKVLRQYKNLSPKLDTYVFNDGTRHELACLDGTIPVMYKGTYYNIPVCIWLLDSHPYNSPMCYVKPTADMQIKASRHVDNNGRIYLPYLHGWKPNDSDLTSLIQVMTIVFGETPPVYSKPKLHETSTFTPPYPTQPSSFMPMPNVASPYPSFPPQANTAMNYSSNTPYPSFPPAPTYAPYPSYNSATGGCPPMPNSYPVASGGGYPPTSTTTQQQMVGSAGQPNATGTITEEHIHASLLSAVEDKLKKRLREVLSQSQAEIEVLKKTQDDLNSGKSKIEDIISRLQLEQSQLEKNIHILRSKEDEMKELLTKMENQEEVNIDEVVITTAPLYKQLLNAFAEENATEDAVYYLGEALRKGVIELDIFLKNVRALSCKQFMLKALMQKCRQKANLPH